MVIHYQERERESTERVQREYTKRERESTERVQREYRETERESTERVQRERERFIYIYLWINTVYIYMYIYTVLPCSSYHPCRSFSIMAVLHCTRIFFLLRTFRLTVGPDPWWHPQGSRLGRKVLLAKLVMQPLLMSTYTTRTHMGMCMEIPPDKLT